MWRNVHVDDARDDIDSSYASSSASEDSISASLAMSTPMPPTATMTKTDAPVVVDMTCAHFVHVFCIHVRHHGDNWGQNKATPEDLMFFDEAHAAAYRAVHPWFVHSVTKRLALKLGDVYHPLGEPFRRPPA